MGRVFLILVLGCLLLSGVGEGKQTIDDLNRDLAEHQAAGDHKGEGITLNELGLVYRGLGEQTKAIAYFEQALAIYREVGNRTGEGVTLKNLGSAYYLLSQYATAIAYSEQALAIHREVGSRTEEGVTLNNLGWSYWRLAQYDRSIAYFEQALVTHREVGNHIGEYETLNGLGLVYLDLGQYARAIDYIEQALAIYREVGGNRSAEGIKLNNLGLAYGKSGQYAKAIAYFEQALAIYREVGNRTEEGVTLNNLGAYYSRLNQYAKAIEYLEQALAIRREVGSRGGEGFTLKNLGLVYYKQSQYTQAIRYFEQALAIGREVGSRAVEGLALNGLMSAWQARAQPRLAIFYGKQAVNVLQDVRTHIQALEQNLQHSFLTTKEDVYRRLADILIAEGRLPEAQQVLDLLKEQEYFDFIRRDPADVATPKGRAILTPLEAAWKKRYHTIAGRVSAIAVEHSNLLAKPSRTEAEEARLAQVEADLTVAGHAFQQFFEDLAAEFSSPQQAQETLFHLRETQGLMTDLRDLGPGTVILYTLVSHQQYRVMLITPDVSIARSYPISARDLNRKVFEFRALIQMAAGNPPPDPRPLARELYEILVAPVANDLAQMKARTLMWSLDGVLRYLPLAALYDGEQYLVERYRLAVFTPASKARLKDTPRPQWQGLGLGVSKAHEGFGALPAVVNELQGIIREEGRRDPDGVLPGVIQLDETFTAQTMLRALRKRYPVVHIASHFQFRPGNETASFLLLGDGSHLRLSQLKAMPNVFSGVDLLTLSACNTAIGSPGADGREVEGFGVLAQRQGAKAVVATLWAVADVSTQALMQTFYRLRETEPGLTKVEALRQAQLSLLHGSSQTTIGSSVAQRGRQAPYAHPYYWAPFLLIGNWK